MKINDSLKIGPVLCSFSSDISRLSITFFTLHSHLSFYSLAEVNLEPRLFLCHALQATDCVTLKESASHESTFLPKVVFFCLSKYQTLNLPDRCSARDHNVSLGTREKLLAFLWPI